MCAVAARSRTAGTHSLLALILFLFLLALSSCTTELAARGGTAPAAQWTARPSESSSQTPQRVTSMPPTHTALRPMTIVPEKTVSPSDRSGLLLDLLQTNGGCSLPCWWGIEPGVTSLSEVQGLIQSFGGTDYVERGPGGAERHEVGFEMSDRRQYVDLDIRGVGDHVKTIRVDAHGYAPDVFWEDWSRWRADAVLAEFGVPTRALLYDFPDGPQYGLTLLYDDKGIAVSYFGIAEGGKTHRICLLPGNDTTAQDVVLNLQSADAISPLDTLLGVPDDARPYIKPIQEATGLTVTDLYEVLTHRSGDGCITTPEDIWAP